MENWLKNNLILRRVNESTRITEVGMWKITVLEVKDEGVNTAIVVFSDNRNGCHITSYQARGIRVTKEYVIEKIQQFFTCQKLIDYMDQQ